MLKLEHLAALFSDYQPLASARVAEFSLGGKHFAFNTAPSLMGVVNLSPDSWYRESVCLSADRAIERGRLLAAQGADIIDLGAESTLAHSARVEPQSATKKLLPIIKALSESNIIVSTETYDTNVARSCLQVGAKVINLTGNPANDDMFRIVAAHDAALILCYVQGENVREVGDFDFTSDIVSAMRDHFARAIEHARKCGVTKLLIDPGLGFYYRNLSDSATRVRHQMKVFLNTFRLRELGAPVCHALPHAFEYFGEEVRSAEPFFAVLAALGKTDLFRTHEVARTRAVVETLKTYE